MVQPRPAYLPKGICAYTGGAIQNAGREYEENIRLDYLKN